MEAAGRPPFSFSSSSSSSSSSGYALGPPWLFRGSALYQLHLVKAETARAFIPKELKLVEAFGYTLGGLFLAHYDDSPAGKFDELVVLAGLVRNPPNPTSCAWAARVLVNSHEACRHGRMEIGLPSHLAVFSKSLRAIGSLIIRSVILLFFGLAIFASYVDTDNKYTEALMHLVVLCHSSSLRQKEVEIMEKPSSRHRSFLNMIGISSAHSKSKRHSEIQVSEIKGSEQMRICNINLPFVVPKSKTSEKWLGPMIRMSLPSYSGRTEHNPQLLKYSCQIECRVRAVEAAKISRPKTIDVDGDHNTNVSNQGSNCFAEDEAWNQSISVLLSKPILALEFNFLEMRVDAPTIEAPHLKKNHLE